MNMTPKLDFYLLKKRVVQCFLFMFIQIEMDYYVIATIPCVWHLFIFPSRKKDAKNRW